MIFFHFYLTANVAGNIYKSLGLRFGVRGSRISGNGDYDIRLGTEFRSAHHLFCGLLAYRCIFLDRTLLNSCEFSFCLIGVCYEAAFEDIRNACYVYES